MTRYLTDCLQWTSLLTSSVSANSSESNGNLGNGRRAAGVCQTDIEANDIKQAFIVTKALDKSSSSISRKTKKVLPNMHSELSQNNEVKKCTASYAPFMLPPTQCLPLPWFHREPWRPVWTPGHAWKHPRESLEFLPQ